MTYSCQHVFRFFYPLEKEDSETLIQCFFLLDPAATFAFRRQGPVLQLWAPRAGGCRQLPSLTVSGTKPFGHCGCAPLNGLCGRCLPSGLSRSPAQEPLLLALLSCPISGLLVLRSCVGQSRVPREESPPAVSSSPRACVRAAHWAAPSHIPIGGVAVSDMRCLLPTVDEEVSCVPMTREAAHYLGCLRPQGLL